MALPPVICQFPQKIVRCNGDSLGGGQHVKEVSKTKEDPCLPEVLFHVVIWIQSQHSPRTSDDRLTFFSNVSCYFRCLVI